MTTILIGVDDSPRSEDALAFALPLARAAGANVVLACAFPYDDMPSRAGNLEYRAVLKGQAERTLRQAAARLDGVDPARVKTVAVPCTSPARALDRLAESEDAELIVVGSTHTSRLGRIVPGSTAERLMHGAPAQVGVAYDGTKESEAALHAATAIARALEGRLRVIGVLDAESYCAPALLGGPGYYRVRETIETEARAGLERRVAALAGDVPAEAVFAAGEVVGELMSKSKGLDLLVAGSRGYGPARSVLLGGVTGRLIRAAECPLLVVPRGHETPLDALFGVSVAAAS